MSIIRGLFGGSSTNPVTAAPAAGTITGTEKIGATQNGADVAIPVAALAAYVLASITSAAPTELPALAIYQRSTRTGGAFSKGAATVSWSVTVAGVPGQALNYRLRDATASGNPVLVASTQALASAAQGAQAVPVSVPCGPYWFLIDWQLGSGAWVLGTQRFAVGEVLAIAGQSLADRLIHDYSGTTIAASGVTIPGLHSTFLTITDSGYTAPAPAWGPTADAGMVDSAFPAQLANRWLAGGVPCAVVGFAHGGTGIGSWLPGQADYLVLKSVLQQVGPFGTLFWFQGHSDSGQSTAAYQANLSTLFNQVKTDFPASAAMKVLIATVPNIASTSWGNDAQINAVRQAAANYAAANPSFATFLASMLDIPFTDGVHQTNAGNAVVADHVYRAMRGAFGLDSAGDRGPAITAATRAAGSAVVGLTVAQAGGTGLVATPDLATVANQFTVFPAGSTSSPYTVSGVALTSATRIDLTLSTMPADGAALDVRYRYLPDASAAVAASGIYDNNTADGLPRGRQLAMLLGPVTAAAPSVAATITVATPAGGTAAANLALSGTYTGTAPTGIGYAFDGGSSFAAATGFTASGGNWSAAGTYPAAGSHTVTVQEANATGVTATSGSFASSAAGGGGNASYLSALPAVGNNVAPVAAYDATLLSGANGAAVATIPDQSASNLPLATGGTVTLGTLNGKTAVHFATASSAKNTNAASAFAGLNTSDMTVLYVAKHTNSGNGGCGFYVGDATAQNDLFSFQTYSGSNIYLGRRVGGSPTYVGVGSNPSGIVKEVARYAGSSGAMAMMASGQSEASGTGSNGSAAFTTVAVNVEPVQNEDARGTSDFLCMIVWPARATDAQRDALLTWATNQFGS